jgi:RNA polymerase sigma-70 factor (ECF subfamily)
MAEKDPFGALEGRAVADMARWLTAARAGSREDLGRALEECRDYLIAIARRELDPALRVKGSASDLVQQTFLEAQRDFGRFAGASEADLLAWLRQLLLNNLANFRRDYRQTGKRQLDREVALGPAGSSGGPAAEVPADTPSPSAHALAHERSEAVRRALDRLPEDYRQVLLLRYEEGRSFEDIARLMSRSPNAASKLWARAVERLEQELGY